MGFLLVDASGEVLSVNAEALRILGYSDALKSRATQTVKQRIASLLAANAPHEPGWSALFMSGRRKYRCWSVPAAEHEGRLAVLMERVGSKSRAVAAARAEGRQLTPRERETATLLVDGLTNKEIAARLGVSVNTVKAFMRSLMLKLGTTTRAGIVGSLFEV